MLNPVEVFLLFLKASALSFGGLASLPILQQDLLARGIHENVFGRALAVGRLSPGPNGLYIVSLGYQVGGAAGAVAASAAMVLPPFVILLIVAWYSRVSHLPRTASALLMLGLAVTGLLGFTSWEIVAASAKNPLEWAAGLAGFLISYRWKIHPLAILAVASAVGIAAFH